MTSPTIFWAAPIAPAFSARSIRRRSLRVMKPVSSAKSLQQIMKFSSDGSLRIRSSVLLPALLTAKRLSPDVRTFMVGIPPKPPATITWFCDNGMRSMTAIPGAPGSNVSMQPPIINGPTVPSPVLHRTSAEWATLPSSLYVQSIPKVLERASAEPNAPPALVPNPAPIGTATLCLIVTSNFLLDLFRSASATDIVVSACGAYVPFMKTLTQLLFEWEILTSVSTPSWVTKPPPRAPTLSTS